MKLIITVDVTIEFHARSFSQLERPAICWRSVIICYSLAVL